MIGETKSRKSTLAGEISLEDYDFVNYNQMTCLEDRIRMEDESYQKLRQEIGNDVNPTKTYQANAYLADAKCQETREKRSSSSPNNDVNAARGTSPQNKGRPDIPGTKKGKRNDTPPEYKGQERLDLPARKKPRKRPKKSKQNDQPAGSSE